MRVLLRKLATGAEAVDVTDRLSEDRPFIMDSQRERTAFYRTVEDLMVTFSNMDDYFTELFDAAEGRKTWVLTVVDGEDTQRRTLFRGRFTPEVSELDVRDEYADVQAFSDLKTFWERTRTTRIYPNPKDALEEAMHYATVDYILDREVRRVLRIPRDGSTPVDTRYADLFTRVTVDPEFASRKLRAWAAASTAADPTIGDNGRYRELFGSTIGGELIRRFGSSRTRASAAPASSGTTTFDLLSAFAVYYGAEFYIDFDADALVMAPRMRVVEASPTPDGPHDIGSVLLDSAEIRVRLVDSEKYDAVHILMHQSAPPEAVVLNLFDQTSVFATGLEEDVAYCVTDVISLADGATFETGAAAPLFVDVESHINLVIKKVWVNLSIPATPGRVPLKKRLYRTRPGGGDMYLLAELSSPSTAQTYLDTGAVALNEQVTPPVASHSHAAWISYDEDSGKWFDPIPDVQDGANAPEGKIFEAIPALSFREVGSLKIKDFDPSDMVAFFGLEARDGVVDSGGSSSDYLEHTRSQYGDLMKATPGLHCSLEGTNFKVGDAITYNHPSNPIPKTSGFIKRAAVDGIREETAIEAVLL